MQRIGAAPLLPLFLSEFFCPTTLVHNPFFASARYMTVSHLLNSVELENFCQKFVCAVGPWLAFERR